MSIVKNIPVLDQDHKFLSYTSSAKARILIKNGKALIFNKDPFMILLKGEGETKMSSRRTEIKQGIIGAIIANFTKYFAEEREVYVQNMGSTQISLSFPSSTGLDTHVTIPRTRKPYNLTQHVPFSAIKASIDFRKIINRHPPILRLLTEEEFFEYYEKRALANRTSIEEEISVAQAMQDTLMNKRTIASEALAREMEAKLEDKMEELESAPEPHPRAIGLCAEADKEYHPRISAPDFLEELESLEDQLTVEDWEFISTKGVYKLVKKHAQDKLDLLTSDEDE